LFPTSGLQFKLIPDSIVVAQSPDPQSEHQARSQKTSIAEGIHRQIAVHARQLIQRDESNHCELIKNSFKFNQMKINK
jgi:hypothetical protein